MKEWRAWLQFSAVEILNPDAARPGTPIIGTRWVLVDKKNVGARAAMQRSQLKAKARLVVLGHREKAYVRSDAPTAVFAVRVRSADASNAYLQAERIDRPLTLRPPRPGTTGTRDAPGACPVHPIGLKSGIRA